MMLTIIAVLFTQLPPPPMVDAVEAAPVVVRRQPEPEPERRRLFELAIPGAVMALGGWAASIGYLFESIDCHGNFRCDSASFALLLPQVGPWVALASQDSSGPHLLPTLGVGIAQLAGLAAMITGFFISVPTDSAASFTLNVAPTGNGIALGGTF